jgi:hypothetical protein
MNITYRECVYKVTTELELAALLLALRALEQLAA